MIELACVACVKTMMRLCEERSIVFLPGVSLSACMMQAQPELAQWSESHPDLRVTRCCHGPGDKAIHA